MVISFYSNYGEKIENSINSLVYSLNFCLKYNKKVVFLNTESSGLEVEKILIGDKIVDLLNYDIGILPIFRLMNNNILNIEEVENYTVPILQKYQIDLLTFISKDKKNNSKLNFDNIEKYINTIEILQKIYDVVIIDINSKKIDENVKKIFNLSNLIIFSTNQNVFNIEKIKKIGNDNLDNNFIINILNYDSNNNLTKFNIQLKYRLKKIIITPYNVELLNAINNFKIVNYLLKNLNNKKNSFIKQIDENSNIILKKLLN